MTMFGARSEGNPWTCTDGEKGYKNHLYQSKHNKLQTKTLNTEHYDALLVWCHRCQTWIPDRNCVKFKR